MIYQCLRCSELIDNEKNDFVFAISCGKCKRQHCGKCFRPSHYPALCHEVQILASRTTQANPCLNQRLARYENWNVHNVVLSVFRMLQTDYEEFSQESHQRFHKHLSPHFKQLVEVINFIRWFRLHVVFNPTVGVVLAKEYTLFETRLDAFVDSVPPPELATNDWNERVGRFRIRSIDIGVSVTDLIFGLPKARHVTEMEDASKAIDHWEAKMVY